MRISDLPNIIRRRKSLARPIVVVLAGIGAARLALAITQPAGPGLHPDSASYLGAAQSLVRAGVYRVPIAVWSSADSTSPLVHFPPGYSTAIAAPVSLGISPLQSARIVNALAAFITLALATLLVDAAAGSLAAGLVAVGLLVMPPFVDGHLSVLSEPLFLACQLAVVAGMYRLGLARSERARIGWSFAGGLAAAAAVMVRYAGISVAIALTLWSALITGHRRDRLRRVAATSFPSLLLLGLWVARTRHTGGTRSIRTLGVYGGIMETVREGVATVVAWLVPLSPDDTLPGRRWIALAFFALLLYASARGTREVARVTAEPVPETGAVSLTGSDVRPLALITTAALVVFCYAAFLLASRLFADPGIPFDDRILLPIFVLIVVITSVALRAWWRRAHIVMRVLCSLFVLAWFLASYHVSSDDVDWALENGYDLAGEPWRDSPLLAWARTNAATRSLFSNWPSAVVLQLGRPAHDTPATSDSTILRQFVDTVRARHGVVIAFDIAAPDMIGVDVLSLAPGLRRIVSVRDGSAFVAAP